MRKILTSFALVAASLAFAQVGVNNDNPQATLDVKAKKATGTTTGTDGILIPRVDRARAQNMSAVEESTLIYVNSVSTGAQSGKAQNINTKGFYYYEGNNTSGKWVKVGAEKTFVRNVRIDNRTAVVIDQDQDGTTPTEDYFLHLTGEGGTVTLPDPAKSKGRMLCFYSQNGTYALNGAIGNSASAQPGYGDCVISNGVTWITAGAF